MPKFCRYELRTTDADGARAFYAKIFGHDRAVIWPLHEQALARGARPHWLGSLGVGREGDAAEVERLAAAFVERGAMQLGPTRPTSYGGQAVVFRDPGGALLAVATPPPPNGDGGVDVVWHVLNTNDATRAATNYRELVGWDFTEPGEFGALGAFRQFAWHPGGENVGVVADIAGRPSVHPQWLYCFGVDALEPAIATTRAAGGLVLDPVVLPSGDRLCVCDDPQGAAFALRERRPRA